MAAKPIPARHLLRQMLRALLPTDSDFEAFCGDYFPDVAERFANGMDRVAKANLLLVLAEGDALVAALKQRNPYVIAKYERWEQAPTAKARNPYRGLSAFQLQEAHLFFGRDALTGQLWQRFESMAEMPDATRLLAIVGPSGSGKSSVARAGLLAALQRSPVPGPLPMRIAALKPGERPIESLARALVPLLPPDTAVLPAHRQVAVERLLRDQDICGEGLRRFADDLPDISASPLVVLVDQFEELYTQAKDTTERDNFVELLLHAAKDSSRHVSVVLTLRSDFLSESQRHHRVLNRIVAEQGVMVPGLNPEELREAIAKPAELAGRPLDNATVELLLAETRSSQAALPLLEFALTRIWDGMERGDDACATLRRIGGVGGALAGAAQRIYQTLTEPEQATTRRALVRLVRLGDGSPDTRRRAPIAELCGRLETEAAVLSVLRKFATETARLVTLSSDGVDSLAEVTHEALFEHWVDLRTWIEQSRRDHELHERAMRSAKLWLQANRNEGRLWRSLDLELLCDYQRRKPDDLNPLQEEFLAASLRLQQSALETAERGRQQLLDFMVERGQQFLFQAGKASDGLLWLHRAQGEGSKNPVLPDLLKSAMESVDATIAVLVGHGGSVTSATFSPDGRRVVTASRDHSARVWDSESGQPLVEIRGHRDRVNSAMFGPDGQHIVTASRDRTARVWNAENGQLVAKLEGHGGGVNSVAYSPDGRRIVSASNDHTALVWEASSGRLLVELRGHREIVLGATYSPNGHRIVTASEDATARVWDADSGRLIAELKGHGHLVRSAAFAPDSRSIVTASADATARVWDAESGRLIAELRGHRDGLASAGFSPDGRRIVTASSDATARVWEACGGRLIAELRGHTDGLLSASHSADGRRIATASSDATARIWEAEGGRLLAELRGHGDCVTSAVFSSDSRRIVTAGSDATVRVWRVDGGRLRAELSGHRGRVTSGMTSPDGCHIVTASQDGTARVWEADGGRFLWELAGHDGSVNSATFSPDGRRIVTASFDGTARVWETEGGRLLAKLIGHGGSVSSAAFSPDGRRIVTASWDDTARVWETDSGRLIAALIGHGDSVNSAAFDLDGRRVATASFDGTARVW